MATSNGALAAQCRTLADTHPTGSLDRRAAACAGVALGSTSSLTAARRALDEHLGEDPDFLAACHRVLDEVAN